MTASNHIITGAVIAMSVSNPIIAIPVAFISHFVMDAIPHFGPPDDMDVFERNKRRAYRLVVLLDIIVSISLLVFLPLLVHKNASVYLLIACMLAAFAPDVGIIYRFVREVRTKKWQKPTNWLMKFHLKIEHEYAWGIFVEVGWFLLMLSLVFELA